MSKFTKNVKSTNTSNLEDVEENNPNDNLNNPDNDLANLDSSDSDTEQPSKTKTKSKSQKPKTTKTQKPKTQKTTKADFVNNYTDKIQVPFSDYSTLKEIYKHQNRTYPVSALFNPYCTKETASKLLVYEGTLGDCDFMIFDGKVLSIKLYYPGTDKKKPKDIKQSEKLIMVNLDEIDYLYEIKGSSTSHQTSFKRIYNNKPVEAKKKKTTTSKVFNTSKYPLTDNTGKWISVCYLIPYLFMSSSKFVELYSNQLFTYILNLNDKENKEIIDKPLSVLPPLRDVIGSYNKINASLVSSKKAKIEDSKNENSEEVKRPKATDLETFLLYSKLQPIIPRLLDDDSVHQSNLENYMKKYDITEDNITSKDISTVQKFYNSLNKSLYNPTDITVINQIMKLEKTEEKELEYPETVKIVKIEKSKFEETKKGIKFDESVNNLFKGIKEVKKGKTDKISYTSQEHYYYELTKIDKSLKLKDICEYIINNLKKKLNISEKELETLKSSYSFNYDDYKLIISTISSEGYKKYQSLQNDKKTNLNNNKKNSPVKTKSVITMKLNNIQEIQDSEDSEEDDNDNEEDEDSEEDKKDDESEDEKDKSKKSKKDEKDKSKKSKKNESDDSEKDEKDEKDDSEENEDSEDENELSELDE